MNSKTLPLEGRLKRQLMSKGKRRNPIRLDHLVDYMIRTEPAKSSTKVIHTTRLGKEVRIVVAIGSLACRQLDNAVGKYIPSEKVERG